MRVGSGPCFPTLAAQASFPFWDTVERVGPSAWKSSSLQLPLNFCVFSVQMVGPWPSLFQPGSFLKLTTRFWLHFDYGSPPFGCKLHGRGQFSLIFLVGWVGFASAHPVSRIMPWTLWLSTNTSWMNEWVRTHWRFLFSVEGRFTLRVSAYLQSREAVRRGQAEG